MEDGRQVRAYGEELETQNRDDAGQETDNHGAERRQHHLPGGSHGNAPGQGSILDVDLQREESRMRARKMAFRSYQQKNVTPSDDGLGGQTGAVTM